MSAQYTVSATPAAQEAGAVTQTVASLPATFSPLPEHMMGTADVLVVSGGPGWTAEARRAIAAGARGIVVTNPVPEQTAELATAAEAAGTAVVLDLRWASNPALVSTEGEADARAAVRSLLATASLLDSVATAAPGSDPRRLFAEHIAVLLAVGGPLDQVAVHRCDTTGYTVSGRLANGAPFAVQGVLSNARPAGVDIGVHTSDGGVSIAVPEPDAAWPAEVRVAGPQGELLLPTLYESAHRAAWRRLADHLSTGTRSDDLAGFARLTDLYETLFDT